MNDLNNNFYFFITIFEVGLPAPCPAFVSILIKNGFSLRKLVYCFYNLFLVFSKIKVCI